jgi:brefeldin A-inhibited guanine nucleotide-exchange protein
MTFLHAVRPHLCLSLSRNGSSSVPRVFEVCCEIFWLMLKHMRVMMKVCQSPSPPLPRKKKAPI